MIEIKWGATAAFQLDEFGLLLTFDHDPFSLEHSQL